MFDENFFRFSVIAILLIAFAYSGYIRRKADQKSGTQNAFENEPRMIYFLRTGGALAGYLGLLAYLIHPAWMSWSQLDLPTWVRLTGLGTCLVMLPLLIWMLSSLGNNITGTVVIRDEHELVTSGPYKYIRHPLYTFGSFMFIGVSLAIANWWVMVGLMIGVAALVIRTSEEEDRLTAQFGDQYREYIKVTGRFFPKF
jgi:protein-S-isoprenylcysteine O-methyltransferase Ste14